jgi:uncharacterized membrane protein
MASRQRDRGDQPDVADLIEDLEDLAEEVEDPEAREDIEETITVARRVTYPSVFGRVIRGFDAADAAEAFVGSVVFGIPMIIESGTLEIGAFIAHRPVYYLGTVLFGVGVVTGLLYVAEIQHVEIHDPLFGVVPRRLAGVLGIAALTSLVLMTAWGRVDWGQPRVASAQVTIVFVGMAIGGALGDILPGS